MCARARVRSCALLCGSCLRRTMCSTSTPTSCRLLLFLLRVPLELNDFVLHPQGGTRKRREGRGRGTGTGRWRGWGCYWGHINGGETRSTLFSLHLYAPNSPFPPYPPLHLPVPVPRPLPSLSLSPALSPSLFPRSAAPLDRRTTMWARAAGQRRGSEPGACGRGLLRDPPIQGVL